MEFLIRGFKMRLAKMQSSNRQGLFYKGASFFVVSSIIFCKLEKNSLPDKLFD